MLITTTQAARRLGVHPATMRRWVAAGKIRFVKVGHVRGIPATEVRRLRAMLRSVRLGVAEPTTGNACSSD
jgi:excisionase family DNA binding protein